MIKQIIILSISIFIFCSCKKNEPDCSFEGIEINTNQKYDQLYCTPGGVVEFEKVFRTKEELDSALIKNECNYGGNLLIPLDFENVVMLNAGVYAPHVGYNLEAKVYKFECAKKLVYELILTETNPNAQQVPNVRSVYCIVNSIPSDFEIIFTRKVVEMD